MRFLLLIVMLTTSACVSSMDELIVEANRTGNWTAVNRRLDVEDEALAVSKSCSNGSVLWCDSTFIETACNCVRTDVVRHQLRENEHRRGIHRQ